MKHPKIFKLLNEASHPKFMTRKCDIVYDQWNANYNVGNDVIYDTEVLKSNLCDCNDAYILVTGNITIIVHQVTQVAFKNFALFTKCITKTDGTKIDDAWDLDWVMAMYNLKEYSLNYSEAIRRLWFY